MRVRVSYTVEVDDRFRWALAWNLHGDKPHGKATREEIRAHYELYGGTADDDLLSEYAAALEAQAG